MSNYHLEIKVISRGKGRSVTRRASYISGERLHDSYNATTYYQRRSGVLYCCIYQPDGVPSHYHDLQELCAEIDKSEIRYDARTAREFVGSLPNELPLQELIEIVSEYINRNFVEYGLCAIAAIHEKRKDNPLKDNPHAHIIVPTRTVGSDGFSKKKDREHNKREYINIWRKEWADVQNRAYERNGLNVRVSHESLEVQGIRDREPTIHLSRIDWQKEMKGEHTPAGDRKRAIKKRNEERIQQRQIDRERGLEIDLSR